MVRVLHVVTYMGRGGLETMLMNYYRHIDRNKVQFDFLVHRDFEADYDKEILSLGGKIHHISRLVPWSRSYKNELKKFFREHPEYKIVHVHQDCLSSVALQCAEECGIPVRIAHCHSASAVKNIKYPIKLHYMKKIPKYATQLFACGQMAGDWMFTGHPFEIVHNAVNLELYRKSEEVIENIKQELGLKDEFVVGHVGSFSPAKNHDFLIDIFNEIVKRKPDSKLLLVGDGDGKSAIAAKVKEYGLSDKVIFTGIRTDVNKLMQVMDVFVFPSLYEGLPVTLIEAQASGLPIVMSDHISTESIVTDGLVKIQKLDQSPADWADEIIKVSLEGKSDHEEEIRQSGYDILHEAAKIQKYYLSKAEENR